MLDYKDYICNPWIETCKNKVGDFPVPSRDVTYQTLPGRDVTYQSLSDIPAGVGKVFNLFFSVQYLAAEQPLQEQTVPDALP